MAGLAILFVMILSVVLQAYVLASVVGLSYLWYRVFKRRQSIQSSWRFVIIWTLLLPGLWLGASFLLWSIGPTQHHQLPHIKLVPIPSAQYDHVEISDTSIPRWWGWRAKSEVRVLSLPHTGRDIRDIDPVRMTYMADQGYLVSPVARTFDREVILFAMKQCGADTTDQDVIAQADEVIQIVSGMPHGNLINLSPTHFTVDSITARKVGITPKWYMILLLLLLPMEWVGGMIMFFRISRNIFSTQPPSPEPASPSHRAD